jgi:hypothetical protein
VAGIGSFIKMAGGQMDADALGAMLRAFGVDLIMEPVTLADAPQALRGVAIAAGKPHASLHRLRGRIKDGGRLEVFMVLIPTEEVTKDRPLALVQQDTRLLESGA